VPSCARVRSFTRLELDKRGEFGDRWMVIHTAARVPVSAESRSPPAKNLPPPASHEPGRSTNPPPGPPHSGRVQPCAAANPAWRRGLQSARLVCRVAELGSLGIIARHL
jgi:hypothetical protein